MLGIIENWLFNQIGINCKLDDLSVVNIFQDGCLFASILKHYGLIDGNITLYITKTLDRNQSFNNLKLLKPVLEMLHINFNDDIINEIVENKLSTTVKLLYELFLCLENKQTLQYLTKHFVGNVPETQCLDDDESLSLNVSGEYKHSGDYTFEKPLIRNLDVVEWYKYKYQMIKDNLVKQEKELRDKHKNESKVNSMPRIKCNCNLKERADTMELLPELDSFPKYDQENLVDYKDYIRQFKLKQRTNSTKKSLEKTLQYDLLQYTWDKVIQRQKEMYNSVFSEIMLKQSQYEKQILTKLIQTENQVKAQNENQIEIMNKICKEEEHNINRDTDLKEEFEALQTRYEHEHKKVIELHRKLYREKQELVKKATHVLCTDVIDSLIDVAVNASYYQQKHGETVPNILWESWKVKFCKSQPIHIPFETLDSGISLKGEVDYDEVIERERELDFVVRNNDVQEYLLTCGRWFYKDLCLALGDIKEHVLAYLVYRVLTLKYPPPQSPLPADIPQFQISGVLLNIYNTECVDKLKILLEKQNMHIFDPDTALKKCVSVFEKETNPPQTEKKKGKTRQNKEVKKNNIKLKDKKAKSLSKDKKKKPNRVSIDEMENPINSLAEKETQTSIPKDDDEAVPQLRTPLGILGEDVFNTLKEGRLVNDDLLVKVIIEYLKTLGEYNGWLILNYPNNMQQAEKIELALTGKRIPKKYYFVDEIESNENIETDENYVNRKSNLLSFHSDQIISPPFQTHFTFFGNIPQSQTGREFTNDLDEELQESNNGKTNGLRGIYEDQNIYQEFSFDSWDVVSMKTLARAILGGLGTEVKSSVELFGEDALAKLTKAKRGKDKVSKTRTGKGKNKDKKDKKDMTQVENGLEDDTPEVGGTEIKLKFLGSTDQKGQEVRDLTITPDDETWRFVSLPLSDDLCIMLATIWETIEACYIQTLNDIIFEVRVVNLRLIPYVTYSKEIIKNIEQTPDVRQDLVNIFIDMYSKVEDKVKVIPEIKSYFHCKIFELQQKLWEIMDEKRLYVESNRQKLIKENWLLTEITLLINNYLALVQIEYDRSLKTFHLVNDYYFSLIDKVSTIKANQYDRIIPKLTQERLLEIENLSVQDSKLYKDVDDLSKKGSDDNFVIRSLLVCHDGHEYSLELITDFLHEEINLTLQSMLKVVQSFSSQHKLEEDQQKANLKKLAKGKLEDKKTNKSFKTSPEKKSKTTKGPKRDSETTVKETLKNKVEPEIDRDNFNFEKERMFKEWKFALDTEFNRFECRLNLIEIRAQEDILEFYLYLKGVFCKMYSDNLKRYDVDISNTNALCNYLNMAIEEEVEMLQPIVFNQNEFFVALGKEVSKEEDIKELTEKTDGCNFTVRQLKRLRNIFAAAGPHGVIRKQPLCYILQDLMLFNAEDNQPHLPRLWNLLNESQLKSVIDGLFGPEYAIDWRDFLIYNLEIPFPNIDDVLSLRNLFLSFDTDNNEVVSFDVYINTPLWFERDLPKDPQEGLRIALIKSLLFDMFRVNDDQINYTALLLYFCKDAEPSVGFQKALCLSVGKRVVISEDEVHELVRKEAELKQSIINLLQNIVDSIIINKEGVLIYDIAESSYESLIMDDVKADITSTKSKSESIISENMDLLSKYTEISESASDSKIIFDVDSSTNGDTPNRSWVSRIPVASVSSVLNASFLHQDKTFTLRRQYINCLEEEADDEGMVEAYGLVTLECIKNLFTMTNKFKITSPCEIIEQFLGVL